MAFRHGSKAVFHIRDGIPGAGSMRDITTYINTTGLPRPRDTAEVTTLGARWKKYITGLTDATFPLEGPWSAEMDEWLWSLVGASAYVDWAYAPAGSIAGYPSMSGSAILTSYEISLGVGDAAKFTGGLQVSGSIAETTL